MTIYAEPDYMGVSPVTPDGTIWSLGHNGQLALVGQPIEYLGEKTVRVRITVQVDSRLYQRIPLSSVLGFKVTETDQSGEYILEYDVAEAYISVAQVLSALNTAAALIRGRFQEAWETFDSVESFEPVDTVQAHVSDDDCEFDRFESEDSDDLPLWRLLDQQWRNQGF